MIKKIDNILSQNETLKFINMTNDLKIPIDKDGNVIYREENEFSISKDLGRLQFTIKNIDEQLEIKLTKMVNSFLNSNYCLYGASYVEYNSKYGNPNLPPHFDGDQTELMVNYQLKSNTSWAIGLNKETYNLEDNSALIFNPNESIHWRTKKTFKDGEFVKMIFFRFADPNNEKDNSHLRYSLDHEILKDVNIFRDSLTN
jgi:hypothetical protein